MMRGLTASLVMAPLVGLAAFGLFTVKHEVKEQEARLAELNAEIQRNQEEVHVLKAEWSYLNDPARLRALSEKFLAMKVMGPNQVASMDVLTKPGLPLMANVSRNGTAMAQKTMGTPIPAAPVAVAAAIKAAEPAKKNEPGKNTETAKKNPPAAKPVQPVLTAKVAPVKPPPAPSGSKARPDTVYSPAAAQSLAAAKPVAPPPPQGGTKGPAQPPARTLIIQSPALAQSPSLPGDGR